MSAIRIAIADDDPFVRAGLREYLSLSPDFEVVGEAGDGHEALQLVREVPADVLLLDLSMPHLSGLEVLRRVRIEAPALAVVVLSAYARDELECDEAQIAPGAYLDKSCPAEEILRTVRRVAAAKPTRELAG